LIGNLKKTLSSRLQHASGNQHISGPHIDGPCVEILRQSRLLRNMIGAFVQLRAFPHQSMPFSLAGKTLYLEREHKVFFRIH